MFGFFQKNKFEDLPYLSKEDPNFFSGKKILVRLDCNVPIQNGKVVDDFRLRESWPTIKFLLSNGGLIRVISHIKNEEDNSLMPVFDWFKSRIESECKITDIFCCPKIDEENCYPTNCPFVIFENIRKYEGEEKNDVVFAERMSHHGEIFVNEAFSVSHREHASVVGIPKFLKTYFGFQFEREVKNLSKVFSPKRPFVAILGGAKFSTKIPLMRKMLFVADKVFVCGALANVFYRDRGNYIGRSVVDEVSVSEFMNNKKIILPEMVLINGVMPAREDSFKNIKENEMIVDAGTKSLEQIKDLVRGAKMIVWNGPLGFYEKGFDNGTDSVTRILAELGGGENSEKVQTIAGGGDTLVSINKLNLADKFTFVSTAGGAMLDFLANETLPGIEAGRKR